MTVNEFYQKVDGDYTDAINRLQSDSEIPENAAG